MIARDLLRLDAVRGIQVDNDGNLHVLHRPADRPWEDYLALEKFSRSGGNPGAKWQASFQDLRAKWLPALPRMVSR
ncbi:MAG: hypothetical protein FJ279_26410 [Planctomycetes bacterium]|nr:hypothetical protein [Planctomycetota bacterium]